MTSNATPDLSLRLLAAWNNVPVETFAKAYPAYEHPNEETRKCWERVAAASLDYYRVVIAGDAAVERAVMAYLDHGSQGYLGDRIRATLLAALASPAAPP